MGSKYCHDDLNHVARRHFPVRAVHNWDQGILAKIASHKTLLNDTPAHLPVLLPFGPFLRQTQPSLFEHFAWTKTCFFTLLGGGGEEGPSVPGCINVSPSLGSLASIPVML